MNRRLSFAWLISLALWITLAVVCIVNVNVHRSVLDLFDFWVLWLITMLYTPPKMWVEK